ncbi:MAG: glycosyltransferase [Moorea sp. SIO2I5]|nr:glycosyltransferase [Moorena sp. SIO2I5]
MRITVIVPTYRRPKDLERCLEALEKQTRSADEVLVIVRDTDAETWAFLEAFNPEVLPIRPVTLSIPGQVAALNAGLDRAQGDIIAITDDDAAPRGNWLTDIETHFLSDHRIGGVGGRDWVHVGNDLENGARERVGRVQWYGRVIGNHHLGVGLPREVDVLKGANMSYRRTAISGLRFDQRLRGTGAQVHNDLGFSLALRKAGWKLMYDPGVAVDHYPAQRFDEDQRGIVFSDTALINAAHNETIVLLDYFPVLQRIIFIVWSTLVGTRVQPGFLQCLRSFPKEGLLAGQKWLASLRGRWQGWLSWKKCLG